MITKKEVDLKKFEVNLKRWESIQRSESQVTSHTSNTQGEDQDGNKEQIEQGDRNRDTGQQRCPHCDITRSKTEGKKTEIATNRQILGLCELGMREEIGETSHEELGYRKRQHKPYFSD